MFKRSNKTKSSSIFYNNKLRRRRVITNRKKRLILVNITLLVFAFIGLGYSTLGNNLGIFGSLTVKEYLQPTLYNVLKKEVLTGGLAKEYTGAHQDSTDASKSTEKIYYWYGSNDSNGTAILDKNNVLFAGHCWQMIRTTDTGGVKMIYNGEAENNQCLNTRGNHVGYAKEVKLSLSTSYYYGTSYIYDKSSGKFSLDGTITTGEIKDGEYTCRSTSSTGTCTTLYFVDKLSSSTTYYLIPLKLTTNYSQFGLLQFNYSDDTSYSLAAVNYMYNKKYNNGLIDKSYEDYILNVATLTETSNYYYSDDCVYSSFNGYTLNNPSQGVWSDISSSIIDKYICPTENASSCSNPFYVTHVDGNKIYGYQLSYGSSVSELDTNLVIGDGYIENGDGSYTITNPVTISKRDWYSNYSNYDSNNYICFYEFDSSTCTRAVSRIINTTNTTISYVTSYLNNYVYAKSFTYDSDTNMYTLDPTDRIVFWDSYGQFNNWSTYHYTCQMEGDKCSTIYYYTYVDGVDAIWVELENGESIEDALDNMLYAEDVNTYDSTIKTGIDAWYNRYLKDYSSYLEDVIYCNDRSISNYGGWNPNGGNITAKLVFGGLSSSTLSCPNEKDAFSVSNNKAKLNYPIGLITYQEERLLNNNNARINGSVYWLGTPYNYEKYNASSRVVGRSGSPNTYSDDTNGNGVRPGISIKPGVEYSSGTGSMADPYVIE